MRLSSCDSAQGGVKSEMIAKRCWPALAMILTLPGTVKPGHRVAGQDRRGRLPADKVLALLRCQPHPPETIE